ncbi:helix-turn-helix protein [Stackebrandtia endophytica]|uniref:Helix-turn-helix protein n=1 Tax=Stackebrandtia endophytica TaxID=1496996 RepID=A0A543AZ38_9ACTN|nr:helix-turn-helix transcriptional regulator [Stackebrandtia endophytica]TQL77833.1 helix-turn-helix protein [Stackebrandtia endophytica]
MAPKRYPTLRTQWLGKELRKHRLASNATLLEAGEYLQRDQATISRIESGLSLARVADVMALLDFYGVEDPGIRANLEQISRDAWHRGWWDGYSRHAPLWMLDLAWMEERADRIRSFDPIVFHGILQTEDYARALMTGGEGNLDEEAICRFVQMRMERKNVIVDGSTHFEAVVDESVLRRQVGGPEILRQQLEHLIDLAESQVVQIRVLPATVGAHASTDGSFTLLDLPQPYPRVGHIDTVAGNLWVEADQAETVFHRYHRLEVNALSCNDSLNMITTIAKGLK